MQGTGTQADPYIPTTLTEFIEAVGSSGAYVALTQDINAADDPEYTGELLTGITINATSISGNSHEVRGVTVRATNLLIFRNANADIYGLYFRDWAHKKTTQAPTFQGYNSSNYDTVFTNCRISVTIDASSNYGNRLMDHIKMERCAADIKYTSTDGAPGYAINYCTIAYTTMHIDGMWLGNTSSNAVFHDTSFPRSAAIFSNSVVYNSIYLADNFGYEYSYVAFTDIPENLTSITGARISASGAVIAIDDSTIPVSLAGVTRATLAQLKDEAWLASVGFLP